MDFVADLDLVLHLPLYRLDGASLASRDAHGHLGTVTGALWRPQGRDFDGVDDGILIPALAGTVLDIDTIPVSLEAWFKTDSVAVSYRGQIVGRGNEGATGWRLACWDNQMKLGYSGGGSITSISTLNTTDWVHVLGVINGASSALYINGLLDNTGTISINAATSDIGIGHLKRDDGSLAWYFDGLIDEVRIYRRALTSLEVHHNHLATKWRYR